MSSDLELYKKAKDAYYNGQEIMSDLEFDELEKSLGISNKGPVGARRNPSYTVEHPITMGSLKKIQVHHDDWKSYFDEADLIVRFERGTIITPKYDGCSFEAVFQYNGKNNEIIKASTRGDGKFGKDITPLVRHLFTMYGGVESIPYKPGTKSKKWMLRGELLINKEIFIKKYSEEFANPRAFVSGTINAEWTEEELKGRPSDLDFVVYEFRINDHHDHWLDKDWTILTKMWKGSPLVEKLPKVFEVCVNMLPDKFSEIYAKMDKYRQEGEYALDGFVIKPLDIYRLKTAREYPKDCVAIKFKPQLAITEVDHIEWKIGKTGEYNPVVIVKPVTMDGKIIKRASGHNYGYLIDKQVSKGTTVVLSLAGDIIPFIYKVKDTSKFSIENLNLPKEAKPDGCHLMAELSKSSKQRIRFVNSANTLNIPTIGESKAEQIWRYLERKHMTLGITNILQLHPKIIYRALGRGKTGHNGRVGFIEVIEKLTLCEIIQSCNFTSCGKKVAEQIENYMLGLISDFSHLPSKAYNWVYDNQSPEYKEILLVLSALDKKLSNFHKEETSSKIPIIMTGKPQNYKTKAEFLLVHPEYAETTSWDKAKIVFTGDLSSTSSKMKKAKSKGIEIQLY
ncbi:MAG: hypothetical protein NC131_06385 [Roseburia sp.]|nr:hypothetical protein [Roseburia sp.]